MKESIMGAIIKAHTNDKKLHPAWPDHPAAQAGIVSGRAGQLMEANLNWKYKRAKDEELLAQQKELLRKRAIQTAVAAIRFLENL